jgi:acetoin utilization protein AcuB
LLYWGVKHTPYSGGIKVKAMPLIQKFMTAMPQCIEGAAPLSRARDLFAHLGVRHLPVQSEGKLVGVVTERDVKLGTSAFAAGKTILIQDVMTSPAYAVRPDAPLDRVVLEMAESKHGCAVVQQTNEKVVGIFTAIDALRVLSDLLHEHYKGHDD